MSGDNIFYHFITLLTTLNLLKGVSSLLKLLSTSFSSASMLSSCFLSFVETNINLLNGVSSSLLLLSSAHALEDYFSIKWCPYVSLHSSLLIVAHVIILFSIVLSKVSIASRINFKTLLVFPSGHMAFSFIAITIDRRYVTHIVCLWRWTFVIFQLIIHSCYYCQ